MLATNIYYISGLSFAHEEKGSREIIQNNKVLRGSSVGRVILLRHSKLNNL